MVFVHITGVSAEILNQLSLAVTVEGDEVQTNENEGQRAKINVCERDVVHDWGEDILSHNVTFLDADLTRTLQKLKK